MNGLRNIKKDDLAVRIDHVEEWTANCDKFHRGGLRLESMNWQWVKNWVGHRWGNFSWWSCYL